MSDTNQLARIMTQQCAVLERVLFSVRGLELLVAAGESKFLARASDEVQELLDDLGTLDAARAMATDVLAVSLGLIGSDPTLDEIVAALPQDDAMVLTRLGTTLRALAEDFAAVEAAGAAVALTTLRLDQVSDAVDRLERSGGAFADSYGASTPAPAVPALRFNVGA